jgi:hypothetical protein
MRLLTCLTDLISSGNSTVQVKVRMENLVVTKLTQKHRPKRPNETFDEYFQRVSLVLPNFPPQVVSQWLYDHFDSFVQRYSWFDLGALTFSLEIWRTEEIIQRITAWNEMAVENWKKALLGHSGFQGSRLGQYMIDEGTWPVPPIVFCNNGDLKMPDGSSIAESELVEGHHRLAYLRALEVSKVWSASPEHPLWILRTVNGHSR